MSLSHFEIKTSLDGRASVVVDDVDVSRQIAALQFQARPGDVPILTLVERVEGSISGDGIVRVESQSNVRTGEVIAEFLEAIDPGDLERVVCERCGFGDSGTMVTLEVLKEWALGHA